MSDGTLQQFAELVRRMRSAQRRYFRERRPGDLEESKRLEREVDDWLRRLASSGPQQRGLFT